MAKSDQTSASTKTKITPELVKQVTDKVYALWLADLKIQQERKRPLTKS
ncbi:MAG: hypothetical protein IAE79_07070 [Anaerolinea sp.]|nr:hypothetical protein [Anaerolinea sp.]